MMEEVFSKLAKKYRNCAFLRVDVDDVSLVAEEYSISVMPTFVFLKKKNIPAKEWQIKGAYSEKLIKTVEQLAKEHAKCLFPGQGHSLTGKSSDTADASCPQYPNVWADKNFVR